MLLITEIAKLRPSPDTRGSTRLNPPYREPGVMSRGRPFQPGNKYGRGRPKGSRNKSNFVVHRQLNEHAESLINRTLHAALEGDMKSRFWCLNKLMTMKPSAPKLKLPPIQSLNDVANALDVVMNATANNKCADAHGAALCTMLGEKRKTIETQDLALRLEELERQVKKGGS
jgi:hypothetical protein